MFRYISTIRKKVDGELKTFVKVYEIDDLRARKVVAEIKKEFGLDNFIAKNNQTDEGIRNLRLMNDDTDTIDY